MSEKLKPCPFCGCDAKIKSYGVIRPYVHYWVVCGSRSCQAHYMNEITYNEKEHAIEAWNRRAE